eukprot:TRINITY_DN37151_c0_g1_i1.p1 TRINITY_DN37151_c0_g1~~TRINITY_DN37151_c0_g1_i1.p1  ORF type:complete len:532 (-),score=89.72 TRINITY_DN37151_c0_g1_i1:45-1640(-)
MSETLCCGAVLTGLGAAIGSLLGSSGQTGPAQDAGSQGVSLRILTVNDVYKPERFAKLRSMASRFNGSSEVVTKLVLPGDLLGGSLFASVHRGESVIDVLNSLDADYCVLGNHEFDYGSERTCELIDKSKFPWLGSNVRNAHSDELFHKVVDCDSFEVPLAGSDEKIKVGVFGLCTPATPQLSFPGTAVTFKSPIIHAQRCVSELQKDGCEVILALTHLTIAQDKELAASCPGITAILGGHDHDPYLLHHNGTLIIKCGQNADHLGVLDFYLQRLGGSKSPVQVDHSFRLLSTHDAPEDPSVLKVAQRWKSVSEAESETLCLVGDVPLSSLTQELRTQENYFGGLVADAIRWSYRSESLEVVAIQNGGFIRQNAVYPAHSALTGTHIREEMPFPKRPELLKLSGAALWRGLEQMLAPAPVAAGSFPQLSHGLRVYYVANAPKMSKIQQIWVHGQEINPSTDYLVAISEFYASGDGDGIKSFSAEGQKIAAHGKLIRDVVVEYLKDKGGAVGGELPGRIQAVSGMDYNEFPC